MQELKYKVDEIGEKPISLPTDKWNLIVDQCYEKYCTVKARDSADREKCPKLSNALLQLHDFSKVVECKRAMKSGDIGRVMLVWKKWSIMVQSIPGITNYSSYLPWTVLLLTVILPSDMATYLRHNLLMSPTGQMGHFLPKDNYLELQNYWLKHFYNSSGTGTNIDQLRDIFSVNILTVSNHDSMDNLNLCRLIYLCLPQLQSMFQSLKSDCGSKVIYQSHKNQLNNRDLEMFILMAQNRDILGQSSSSVANSEVQKKVDTYVSGMAMLRYKVQTKDPEFHAFIKHLNISHVMPPDNMEVIEESSRNGDDSSASEDF
jgi:hypothetical protein